MIEYSSRAFKAIAFLFQPYNDIDVYVEDETCLGMYELLITRILDNQAKVQRVFQLGGRENVIADCKLNQTTTNRRRLYIIDGDFNAALKKRSTLKLKYLYQLKVYCSENLVFTRKAIVEVAFESLTNVASRDVEKVIGLSVFYEELRKLIALFAVYIAAHVLDNSIQTTKFNVDQLIERKSGLVSLSDAKLAARIDSIKTKLYKDFPKKQVNEEIRKSKAILTRDSISALKLISGKTYLLPLLYHYLRAKAGYSGTLNQLKVRLARYCELDVDKSLRSVVLETSRLK
jgi:hypothetical protein